MKSNPVTQFLSRWQEYGWLIVVLALAIAAYYIIPAIDPRSGIDGWGDLFHALVNVFKGVLAVCLAWLCKAHFWHELEHKDEDKLIETMTYGGRYRVSLTIHLLDRLGWLFWLAFWSWVLFAR